VRKSILKWFVRVLVIDAAIAVLVPIFQRLFGSHAPFSALLRQYLFAVIYSNLIGIPISLALPPIWTRTLRWPLLSRSAVRGGVILIANFIGCLLAGIILRSMIGRGYEYWSEFRGSFGVSLVLSAIAVSFISMYESQESRIKNSAMQLKTKELERERALKLATEARLSSLEARIHPHFLFNTINSVSSLIHEDPLRAERILTQLAELLRFSLDAAPGGLVPLERELQIVEDYLEIEKARFGSRLHYDIQVPASLGEAAVPPLALQTLVENSVKYAVGPRGRGGKIFVNATEEAQHLRLEVQDDGPGFATLELPAGHGLNNLQERIAALFGESARLDIVRIEERTVVALEIPYSFRAAAREFGELASVRA
jgi:sensor histidine kinase YesM